MNMIDRLSLKGRKALVTGASKGIGLEACRALAEAGADVVAVARDAGGLKDAKAAVEGAGRRCLTLSVDVADADAIVAGTAEALSQWGTLDILVNNAGTSVPATLIEQRVEDWDKILAVNLRAPWLFAKALAPGMIAQKRGKIINISSQTSSVALVEHGAYAASKNGLNGLTKVMTVEWAPHNIQSNAICPTVVMTPMGEQVWSDPAKLNPFLARVPAGRVARIDEICDLILFLASNASDMINGETIFVDGGYTAI